MHFIQLENVPILEQLRLEEALLRTDERSFCLVNYGSPRAIVMGISGQPEVLLNVEAVKRDQIPVIKRFSGGGTVIVDENTLFITFIMEKDHINIPAFPEPILRWSADLYATAWGIPGFHLKENDYCIGDKKCGGNAQYIKKDRWLHHTSFLWDYSEENMKYLRLPAKRPKYRQDREHHDFLTPLKTQNVTPNSLIERLIKANVKRLYMTDVSDWKWGPHRQSTHLVDL